MESRTPLQLLKVKIKKSNTKAFKSLTYQEWYELLDDISNSHHSKEVIVSLISESTFEGSDQLLSSVKRKIVETVNKMLSVRIKEFQRHFISNMEISDYEYIELVTKRFKRKLSDCYFFKDITFIEQDFIKSLETSLENEIKKFVQALLSDLQRLEEEFNHEEFVNMTRKISSELYEYKEVSMWGTS
jgi:hypothetical protein